MRTAVVYTGAMRSFDRCWITQSFHVFRHFGECSFFLSTYKDGTEQQADLLQKCFPKSKCVTECIEQPYWTLEKPWVKGQFYSHEPYAISVPPQHVISQLWHLGKGWELFLKNAKLDDFDCVIRIRPDLYFHSFRFRPMTVTTKTNGVGNKYVEEELNIAHWSCLVPPFGAFGGCNDRFAVLGTAVAESYFTCWERFQAILKAKGCPLHPESIVRASIEEAGWAIDCIPAFFSTLRADGTLRAPEFTPWDLAHLIMGKY